MGKVTKRNSFHRPRPVEDAWASAKSAERSLESQEAQCTLHYDVVCREFTFKKGLPFESAKGHNAETKKPIGSSCTATKFIVRPQELLK